MRIGLTFLSLAAMCAATTLFAVDAHAGNPGGQVYAGKRAMVRSPRRTNTVRGYGNVRSVRDFRGYSSYGAVGLGTYGVGGFGFGGLGPGGFGLGGFGALSNPYATGRIPTPPYFAIHPPVYYSAPVPRTYGYSPFAYPGWVRTPELAVQQAEPAMTVNPYVTPTSDPAKKSVEPVKTADEYAAAVKEPQPQVVVNPFVKHPSAFPLAFDMEVVTTDK